MAYQILKSAKALAQFKSLYQKFDRMSDMEKAITWFLERTPYNTRTVDLKKANCRLWITQELPSHFPVVRIVYRVADDLRNVTIISIEEQSIADPSMQ